MLQNNKVRIQKMLADCGIASRRKAEVLVQEKCVTINGQVANIGDKVDPKKDDVRVKGKKILKNEENHYIMLHKPRGFVSTVSDEKGRKCVADLVKDIPGRLYPIGRLDKDSEGLLLMTNDGEFANEIMHPSRHIPKKYRVTIKPKITEEQITALCVGMEIDGKQTLPAQVRVLSQETGRVVFEITLHEGRNRQIRKMCEKLGLEVARLKRIAIGQVKLGMLQQGKWRNLTQDELKLLFKNEIN